MEKSKKKKSGKTQTSENCINPGIFLKYVELEFLIPLTATVPETLSIIIYFTYKNLALKSLLPLGANKNLNLPAAFLYSLGISYNL